MKARAIDKYIRRATAGLPHDERIDTAAELRVNLNLRIKELMLEGYTKEEAEFLAIKEMGNAFTTNRAFLGHVFTHRFGWALVICTLLAGAGWWLQNNWYNVFPWGTEVRQVELSTKDIDQTLRNDKWFVGRGTYLKFQFQLPRGTKKLEVALVSKNKTTSGFLIGRTADFIKKAPEGVQLPLEVGLLLSSGIENQSKKISEEIHRLNIDPFPIQGENFNTSSAFNFISGVGIQWANLQSDLGVQKSVGTLSWGCGISYVTGQRGLRLNQWLRLVFCTIQKTGRTQLPTAEVHVLIRASDQELGRNSSDAADIQLRRVGYTPTFVNKNETEIKVQ